MKRKKVTELLCLQTQWASLSVQEHDDRQPVTECPFCFRWAFHLSDLLCFSKLFFYFDCLINFFAGTCTPCSKQPDLEITSPKTIQAPSGSCLQIPCKFNPTLGREFDGRGKISGVWIKRDSRYAINPSNVVFNSSRSFNNYTMDIIGNLSQRNCTTLFSNVVTSYSDTYFFRVESKSFSATASCTPVKVMVEGKSLLTIRFWYFYHWFINLLSIV